MQRKSGRKKDPRWWVNNTATPRDQEEVTAHKFGGRRSVASGSIFGDFDVNSPHWIIDCKQTDKHSHSIDYRRFQKIREKARLGQIPAYIVEYREHNDTLAILREADLLGMVEYIKNLESQVEGNERTGGGGS